MSEERDAEGAADDVDKDAGTEEDLAVYGIIVVFGVEVVGSGVVVCPGFTGQEGSRGAFDVIEVEEGVEWWWAGWGFI